jgi:protein-disulfide isomerase
MIKLVLNLLVLISLLNLASCSEPQEANKPEDKVVNTAPATNPQPEIADPISTPQTNTNDTNSAPTDTSTLPAARLPVLDIKQDDIVLGDANAKVVVIEYFSPTCPACAAFHKNTYQDIKTKYIDTNKIAYVVRELVSNKLDMDAATLARCNGDAKKYTQFIDVLLSQQQSWATNNNYREVLTNIGQLGGISGEKYVSCSSDKKLQENIINRTKEISTIPDFVATPNFFVSNSKTDPHTMVGPDKILETIEKALQS